MAMAQLLVTVLSAAVAAGTAPAAPAGLAEAEEPAPPAPEEEQRHAPLPGSKAHLPPALRASTGEPILYRELAQAASQEWVRNICVTGLDGHAAAVLLLSSPKAVVYRCAEQGETRPGGVAALGEEFGPRYVHLEGNTQHTLPELAKRRPRVNCDLIFAGGRPDATAATIDLANLRLLANPRYNEVFAVNASGCGSDPRCVASGAAWQAAVEAGILNPGRSYPTIAEDGGRRLLAGEFEPEAAEIPHGPAPVAPAHVGGAHAAHAASHSKHKLRGQPLHHHAPRRISYPWHPRGRETSSGPGAPWKHFLGVGLKHKVKKHPPVQKHAKAAGRPRRASGAKRSGRPAPKHSK